MDRIIISRVLAEAYTIVDGVLPFGPSRDDSTKDRTELRKSALTVVFAALLPRIADESSSKSGTVIHLTNPELRAGNRERGDASGYGWIVRDVPNDGKEHPRGTPCYVCSESFGV